MRICIEMTESEFYILSSWSNRLNLDDSKPKLARLKVCIGQCFPNFSYSSNTSYYFIDLTTHQCVVPQSLRTTGLSYKKANSYKLINLTLIPNILSNSTL